MRLDKLMVCMALILCLGCARANPAPLHATVERFVTDVSAGLAAFDVIDHRAPRADRKTFVAKAFDLAGAEWRVDEWKELHVAATGGKPSFHIGLALVRYDNAEAAARAYAKLPPPEAAFLAETKILTRFVALRREAEILFVYSETFLQPAVQKFLDGLPAAGEQLWKP